MRFWRSHPLCVAVLDAYVAVVSRINNDPMGFFKTLWSGIKQGFGQFKANIAENAQAMLKNLLAHWLGPAGIITDKLPTLSGFIIMGLSVIGLDVSKIVEKIEKGRNQEKKEEKEPSALDKFLEGVKTGGISVLVDYIKPHLSGLGGEIIKETIPSLIPSLIAQGVAKLAMMATPVGGIVAAIKGVWDLIQFFRSNFEAMAGLASALLGVLVNAANGDPGAAANAVEAALCQAIPLAIDLITRLIGINVGKRVKDIVARISKKIRGVIDRLINKLNRTKLSQKFTQATGRKIPTFQEREQSKEAKEAREKEQAEDTRRVREREASQSDNRIAAAAASMGNRGTQLSDYVSDRKKAQSNKVFNVTGLTGALKGEKEGDLGVNLDNSEYVTTTSERNAQKIDNYFENRKAEKLRLAELEAQKKRIAETPENGDNGGGGVLALPSEQVDESHVTAQQSDALEEQDSRVVAEQTQTSEQVGENNVEARQFGASEKTDAYEEKSLSRKEEFRQRYESLPEEDREAWLKKSNEVAKKAIENIRKKKGRRMSDRKRITPTAVCVAIDMRTGKVLSVGFSGRDDYPSELDFLPIVDKLQQKIDKVKKEAENDPTNMQGNRDKRSYTNWGVDNCAEVDAVNKALAQALKKNKNLEIKDIFLNTRRVKRDGRSKPQGAYIPPCENCQRTFHDAVFLPFEGIQNIYDQTE